MKQTTRLAPSPTGALHLGNARTFLINAALAHQNGWRTVLRVEDLDTPRTKTGADQQAIDDLAWLGLSWDGGVVYQTPFVAEYESAVSRLLKAGRAYYCTCSRKDIETAGSAPHASDGAVVYPGTCRDRYATAAEANAVMDPGRSPAVRFRVPDTTFHFEDAFAGMRTFDLPHHLGDFVIARLPAAGEDAPAQAAYQLAVVVDDARQNVTQVVRGDDLIDSTPRQLLLYDALGLQPVPSYTHVPLVLGEDGRRLAKRHGDTRLALYREAGVPAEAVVAVVARWCGIPAAGPMPFHQFADSFSLAALPPGPVTFTSADDAFLLSYAQRD